MSSAWSSPGKALDKRCTTPACGNVSRAFAASIGHRHVRACLEQPFDQQGAAIGHDCEHQGGAPAIILRIAIGTGLEQRADALCVGANGQDQRGVAIIVACIDRGPARRSGLIATVWPAAAPIDPSGLDPFWPWLEEADAAVSSPGADLGKTVTVASVAARALYLGPPLAPRHDLAGFAIHDVAVDQAPFE